MTVAQRRRALVTRHHLDGSADGPLAATRAVLALHATDPASVYLSVLARSARSTVEDVAAAMYERRELVRWMAMRRTLFVFDRADVPLVQAAVSTPLAQMLRRRLLSQLRRNGTDPPVDGDLDAWLDAVADRTEAALRHRGDASGAQLGVDEPALRTTIRAGAPSDPARAVTSLLLTVMSAEGRIVRGIPTGTWTSRHHRWEPVSAWWPDGLPELEVASAQRDLARRWLERFGPATADDLQWWTGWTKTVVRRALADLPVEEIDLHGTPGIALTGEPIPAGHADPVATLLPALDPTPMGWRHRDWFFGIDRAALFDRNGNIGPTLWWDGEIVGAWAVASSGEVRTALVADLGMQARDAVQAAAATLQDRLAGTVVTPVFRTPLSDSLTG